MSVKSQNSSGEIFGKLGRGDDEGPVRRDQASPLMQTFDDFSLASDAEASV